MFYHLFLELSDQISALNVFRYITFRTGGALMTALFLVFMFGPWLISKMRIKQGKGQPIREDGPARHIVEKQGTPTMGGRMILASVLVSTLLWADLSNLYVWSVLFVTMGFGAIGFYDDYLKVTRAKTGGFSARFRLALEFIIAVPGRRYNEFLKALKAFHRTQCREATEEVVTGQSWQDLRLIEELSVQQLNRSPELLDRLLDEAVSDVGLPSQGLTVRIAPGLDIRGGDERLVGGHGQRDTRWYGGAPADQPIDRCRFPADG